MLVQNLAEAWNKKAMDAYWLASKVGNTGFASTEFLDELREEFNRAATHARFWAN